MQTPMDAPHVPDRSPGAILSDLIDTAENGRLGFQQAAEAIAEDGRDDIAERLRQMAQEREGFAAALRDLGVTENADVDSEGTVAGAVHRGWLNLKGKLAGNDVTAVLEAARTGEEHALEVYDEALEAGLEERYATVVRNQAESIRNCCQELAQLS